MDIESDIVALLNENEGEKMQVPQTHQRGSYVGSVQGLRQELVVGDTSFIE